MTTISDIIHAAASNQDRPMMRFRNMENFDKSFLDRKFDESKAVELTYGGVRVGVPGVGR